MSATYTICIVNKSGQSHQYALFNQDPSPAPHPEGPTAPLWMLTTDTPSPDGKQTLTIEPEHYALCGTLPIAFDDRTVAKHTDSTPVNVCGPGAAYGTEPTLVVTQGVPKFAKPFGSMSTLDCFGISTGGWDANHYSKKIWLAYGKLDDKGRVVPVSMYAANPNQLYTFQPKPTFYICPWYSRRVGGGSVTMMGITATIDFTKALPGQTIATVTQDTPCDYSIVFSYPPSQNSESDLAVPV